MAGKIDSVAIAFKTQSNIPSVARKTM